MLVDGQCLNLGLRIEVVNCYVSLMQYPPPVVFRLPVVDGARDAGGQVEVGQAGVGGLAAPVVAAPGGGGRGAGPARGDTHAKEEDSQQKYGAEKLVHSGRNVTGGVKPSGWDCPEDAKKGRRVAGLLQSAKITDRQVMT